MRRNPHPWWMSAAAFVAAGLVRALGATWRIDRRGIEAGDAAIARGEGCIFAVWHARLFPFVYTHRNRGIVVLVSRHRDGEWITRLIRYFGFGAARGSSTRGGEEGVRQLIAAIGKRRLVGVTPDGPRGPRELVKPGLVWLASRTGLPVVPIASAANHAHVFSSWDRFRVPLPFARVVVSYGEPIRVPRDLDAEQFETWRLELEGAIRAVTQRVEAEVSGAVTPATAGGIAMNATWAAYRMLAPAVGALAPMARWFTSPHERDLWNERLGYVARTGECHAWVHASSLGEATAVKPLADALIALQPLARLHLTATTRHGRGRLSGLGLPVSLAPFDAPQAVDRFFARVRPQRLMLIETELWPHWLLRARAARVPVVVASARLSPSSVKRYRRLGSEFQALIRSLSGVIAQTGADAERWLAIGAPPERIAVGGNLKHDALPAPARSRAEARAAAGLDRERPLLVLGSLRPGEARILARAWLALADDLRSKWQVVAVPRHARATRELVEEAAAGRDPRVLAWRWDDTPGGLIGYYAGADVAFVGGSLVPRGGHNPLEPAACGAAVLMGPHHSSQLAGVKALAAKDAITVVQNPAETRAALSRLLEDAVGRERQAAAAREVAAALRGAGKRTVAQLAVWNVWPVE